MTTTPAVRPEQEVLIIHGEDGDSFDLLQRARENLERRTTLPPLAAAMGFQRMSAQRRQILSGLKSLQESVGDCGRVRSRRSGWLARLELFFKKCIRKLIFRHLLQQHRVHLRMLKVLQQLSLYLEDEDQCLRACIDHSDQQRIAAEPKLSMRTKDRASVVKMK